MANKNNFVGVRYDDSDSEMLEFLCDYYSKAYGEPVSKSLVFRLCMRTAFSLVKDIEQAT